jgi:hypothetical protein
MGGLKTKKTKKKKHSKSQTRGIPVELFNYYLDLVDGWNKERDANYQTNPVLEIT